MKRGKRKWLTSHCSSDQTVPYAFPNYWTVLQIFTISRGDRFWFQSVQGHHGKIIQGHYGNSNTKLQGWCGKLRIYHYIKLYFMIGVALAMGRPTRKWKWKAKKSKAISFKVGVEKKRERFLACNTYDSRKLHHWPKSPQFSVLSFGFFTSIQVCQKCFDDAMDSGWRNSWVSLVEKEPISSGSPWILAPWLCTSHSRGA